MTAVAREERVERLDSFVLYRPLAGSEVEALSARSTSGGGNLGTGWRCGSFLMSENEAQMLGLERRQKLLVSVPAI